MADFLTVPHVRGCRLDRPRGASAGAFIEVPVGSRLADNPLSARRALGDLGGLVTSIAYRGVLQPLIVATVGSFRAGQPGVTLPEGAEYVLLAGYRRRAAARRAGLGTAPAIVRDDIVTVDETAVLTLVENVHRAKLGPLAEARMLAVLRDLGLTQREICERTGISQGQVSKRLRLLELPMALQDRVEAGTLTVLDALTVLQTVSDSGEQERVIELSSRDGRSVRSVMRNLRR